MIKNYLLIFGISIGVHTAKAQSHLRSDGHSINISGSSKIVIQGNLNNNNGTINNAGSISMKGNLTQSGTGVLNPTGSGSITFNGTTAQSVQSATSIDVKNLVVDNNNKLTLLSNLIASNSIDLSNNSDIELGSFNLDIVNGTVSNYDIGAYIVSNGTGVLKTTLNVSDNEFLPIGNSSFNPIRLVSNSGATDIFSVAVTDDVKDAGNSGTSFLSNSVDRTWNISEAVAGGNNVNITLQWNQSEELLSFDRANSTVMHWNGTIWDLGTFAAATNVSGTNWSQTITGITSFSPFGVADNNLITLPIELTTFTGFNENEKNLLNWITAKESNNLGFEIERSWDGNDFQKIGFVPGKGNSNQSQNYNFVDNQPFQGLNYYRFKQIDINGIYKFSQVLAILNSQNQILVYPNPTQGIVTFSGQKIENQTAKLINLVSQSQDILITNNQINLQNTPAGIYFLQLNLSNSTQTTLKITKE